MQKLTRSAAQKVRMLSFDCRGARRTRIDDVSELKNSAQTPFAHTFKHLLVKDPSAFQWEVDLNRVPSILLTWESLFHGVATVHIKLGGAPACVALLLGTADPRGENAIIDGLADKLAAGENATFSPAFIAIRAAKERPLIAMLQFPAIDDEPKLNVVNGILLSIALAYFAPPAAEQAGAAVPVSA